MKKTARILFVFSLVLILSLASTGTAFAGKGGNPKGTVTSIDEGTQTMVLETADGPVTVTLPDGFDYGSVTPEMYVVVRGEWTGDDTITATTVKETTSEDEKEDAEDSKGDDGEGNGNKQNVYCAGRKEKAHPMATGIAETYGVDEEQVMAMFCEGNSIGAIMLALQTQQMNGADPAETLAQRKGGKGWGEIWKDAGLIGNAEEGLPPGQAKKLNNPGQGNDQDKKDNPGNGGTPPGQENKDNPDDGGDNADGN